MNKGSEKEKERLPERERQTERLKKRNSERT